jgi:hypothetical protein
MPGPPVSSIKTSDDIGLGTYEMKVKGTYVTNPDKGYVTSRYLFNSKEEEDAFFANNPKFKKGGFLDLDDAGKQRGPDIPFKIEKQKNQDIGEKVAGSPPKKPRFTKNSS